MTAISIANRESGHHHLFARKLIIYVDIFDPCNQLIPWTFYIALWCLFNIHSLFFTMIVTFGLLNWLFTSKCRNCIHNLTAMMFEDTSVTTSDDPHFPSLIFTISRNGTFSIWFSLTVLVAATPIAFRCLSRAGIVK